MKKVFLILLVALTSGVFAQTTSKEDLEIIQGIYGKSKKDLAVVYMEVPDAKSAAFWKVYDEFEAERKVLGQAKVAMLNEYAVNYNTLNDESADRIAKAALKNNLDYQKLFIKYYDKYKKVVGAVYAAKIIEFENYMQTNIQMELQNAIPFIGDLERTKIN